jgi:hypothetical protein
MRRERKNIWKGRSLLNPPREVVAVIGLVPASMAAAQIIVWLHNPDRELDWLFPLWVGAAVAPFTIYFIEKNQDE